MINKCKDKKMEKMQRQEDGKNDFGVESNVADALGARLSIAGSNLKMHRPAVGFTHACRSRERGAACR